MADPRETPAMQQYARFKQKFPGCILLFRMGDFYEMFDQDAVVVSKAIGLTLTQRSAGVPMAGMPYHQLEVYLRRLIRQGFRVAVADQVQDPKEAKGIVARAVTRVVTPGTLVDDTLLENDAAVTLAALSFTGEGDDSPASLAIVEASTGSLVFADATHDTIIDELVRRGVSEVLYAETGSSIPIRVKRVLSALSLAGTPRPAWLFRMDDARRALFEHFGVSTLAGFGLRDDDPAIPAAGAVLDYLKQTQTATLDEQSSVAIKLPRATLSHLSPPRRESPADTLTIDAVSLRALEIERTMRSQSPEGSLLGLFLSGPGGCRTAMGKRLLRDWFVRPLRVLSTLQSRQACVAALVNERRLADDLRAQLSEVQDIARIAGRVAVARATPRDLVALGRSLAQLEKLLDTIGATPAFQDAATRLAASREALSPLAADILARCVDTPPAHLREGGLFRPGFDAALDEAKELQTNSTQFLARYQEELARDLNIPGLKVGYNKVFGYYIELTAAQARANPAVLTRVQTLKNAERYSTPALRELESKITGAQARAIDRERELFDELCTRALAALPAITSFAGVVAELDALASLADRAVRRSWVRPDLTEDPVLDIHSGRHPVLEELLGTEFVPNDATLGDREARLALITGPNMAGKSTYIRQVALITLLAHVGSFVPADRATIGLCDRIFTRIGADDALHAGQSTFMVEMTETANILHHAGPRSLVVLDEIGRGTSTLDGLSLAWAIAEHLAAPNAPRALFATHYHELTSLEERLPGQVRNLHVEVREWPPGDPHAQIVFLHRILPGRTDRSYGIHVARLAGLPLSVVQRAREVLASLAVSHSAGPETTCVADASSVPDAPSNAAVPGASGRRKRPALETTQLPLFTTYLEHPAVDQLRELKIESLTPLQAFDALRALKASAEDQGEPSPG